MRTKKAQPQNFDKLLKTGSLQFVVATELANIIRGIRSGKIRDYWTSDQERMDEAIRAFELVFGENKDG